MQKWFTRCFITVWRQFHTFTSVLLLYKYSCTDTECAYWVRKYKLIFSSFSNSLHFQHSRSSRIKWKAGNNLQVVTFGFSVLGQAVIQNRVPIRYLHRGRKADHSCLSCSATSCITPATMFCICCSSEVHLCQMWTVPGISSSHALIDPCFK